MKTMISSLTGCLFLFIGLAAVLIMLFLKGRSGHKIRGSLWIRTHRLCGYSFIIIYLLMAAGMVIRISGWREEFSPRVILHILSALVIFPLAGFKILIVRKLKLLSPTLLFLGLTLFSAAFVMNALTAGYYFLHRADVGFITPEELTSGPLDDKIGRELVIRKCA